MATWNINIGGRNMVGRPDNYREFAGKDEWPFAVGEVRGVRTWRICSDGCLHPLHVHYAPPWTAGVNVAVCRRPGGPPYGGNATDLHGVPDDGCSCGFYAYFDVDHEHQLDIQMMLASGLPVVVAGIVRGYGRTLIGSRGFRCEKAEIESLYLDPRSRMSRLLDKQYPNVPRVRRPKYERGGGLDIGDTWPWMLFAIHDTNREDK